MTQTPRKTRNDARQDRPGAPGAEATAAGAATGAMLLGVLDPGRLVAETGNDEMQHRIPEAGFVGPDDQPDQGRGAQDSVPPSKIEAHTGHASSAHNSAAPDAQADALKSVQEHVVQRNGNTDGAQAASDLSAPVDHDADSLAPADVTDASNEPSTALAIDREAPSQVPGDHGPTEPQLLKSVTAETLTALSNIMTDLGSARAQSTSDLADQVTALSDMGNDTIGSSAGPVDGTFLPDVSNLYEPLSDLPDVTEIAETLSAITGGIDHNEAIGDHTATSDVASSPISSPDIASMTDIGDKVDLIATSLSIPDGDLGPPSEALASIIPDADAALAPVFDGGTVDLTAALPSDPVGTVALPETVLGAVGSAGEASFLSQVFYDDGQADVDLPSHGPARPDLAENIMGDTSLPGDVPLIGTSYPDSAGAEYDGSGLHLGGIFG
ncbi:hypothetical protein [Pseudooceanicola sp.]|uniref:hypothetical protein n=1 Tax=Pseudooceanicola sp. TaxID=1914328 RepID=UPI0035C74D89